MSEEYDVVVVGAGPAGLSAGLTLASEGRKTLIMDSGPELGGQASKSSLIENYPGYLEIPGEELTSNMIRQARKFGAEIRCPSKAENLRRDNGRRVITTDFREEIVTKTVILAAGLSYRTLNAPGVGALINRGIQYGAPTHEPGRLGKCCICIVGAANSAGQAAMFLSGNPEAQIKMIARRPIEDQMSTYLVDRIDKAPNIEVCLGVEVQEVRGQEKLECVVLRHLRDAHVEEVEAQHLFIFIGASPKTFWLDGDVATDERNFVLTGNDLGTRWRKRRPPLPHETSMSGVFCGGDVRAGSTKRIPGAIGDGAGCVQDVHQYLRLLAEGEA